MLDRREGESGVVGAEGELSVFSVTPMVLSVTRLRLRVNGPSFAIPPPSALDPLVPEQMAGCG
ncbi:hypothetical protein ACFZBM_34380 [Streptomyces lavendulae]|uniref:hypothetical protein n=1 Tax=Streptomyces lavendulae TaxID=1914 RepID=UPI0036E81017